MRFYQLNSLGLELSVTTCFIKVQSNLKKKQDRSTLFALSGVKLSHTDFSPLGYLVY